MKKGISVARFDLPHTYDIHQFLCEIENSQSTRFTPMLGCLFYKNRLVKQMVHRTFWDHFDSYQIFTSFDLIDGHEK